ncbi:MAG: ABC transporter permease [Defluviitaleaceae bacterium]|nr:ABC transporter permease [Defluviitaleaceae bacterium]
MDNLDNKVDATAIGDPMDKKMLKAEKRKIAFTTVLWKEIKADKLALVSLILLVGIVLTVFIWSMFLDAAEVTRMNLPMVNRPPSQEHVLGTDDGGRDVLNFMVMGARNSLNIAFFVTIIAASIGVLVGITAGFYGGRVDNVMMRIVDTVSMLPFLMIIILFIVIIPRYGIVHFILLMSLFGWFGISRQVRARALQQGRLDYVSAAKTLGTPNPVIIFREVLPNLVSILSVLMTLNLANNVGLEVGLTFLGFGMPHGTPSLGNLIALARVPVVMEHRWWQWIPASLLVLVIALCINFVGQAVNRAADARQRLV